MISVIIARAAKPDGIGPTLAALVPAAIAGLVVEVVLLGDADNAALAAIAEGSGARVAADAHAAQRGPWLLTLAPGMVLGEAWVGEARRHVDAIEAGTAYRPARFVVPRPWLVRRLIGEPGATLHRRDRQRGRVRRMRTPIIMVTGS